MLLSMAFLALYFNKKIFEFISKGFDFIYFQKRDLCVASCIKGKDRKRLLNVLFVLYKYFNFM